MARTPHSGGPTNNWGRGIDSGGSAFGDRLGGEALDLMASGDIAPASANSPSPSEQLDYLRGLKQNHGRDALENEGVRGRTLRRWMNEKGKPRGSNREKLNRAYWRTRATNWQRTGRTLPPDVRQAVAGQLASRAHGKRMTIIPVDHRDVSRQAQGAQKTARERDMRPSNRSWDNLVDTWAGGDETQMDDAWMDFAGDIDSPPELYYEVGHVGFSF